MLHRICSVTYKFTWLEFTFYTSTSTSCNMKTISREDLMADHIYNPRKYIVVQILPIFL